MDLGVFVCTDCKRICVRRKSSKEKAKNDERFRGFEGLAVSSRCSSELVSGSLSSVGVKTGANENDAEAICATFTFLFRPCLPFGSAQNNGRLTGADRNNKPGGEICQDWIEIF